MMKRIKNLAMRDVMAKNERERRRKIRRKKMAVRTHLRRQPGTLEMVKRPEVRVHPLDAGKAEDTQDVEIDGRIVGQYRFRFVGSESALIEWVGIRADYRGMGYGRIVVERILDELQLQGIERVYVYAVPEARGFWEHMGFEPTAIANKHGYGMVKHLT